MVDPGLVPPRPKVPTFRCTRAPRHHTRSPTAHLQSLGDPSQQPNGALCGSAGPAWGSQGSCHQMVVGPPPVSPIPPTGLKSWRGNQAIVRIESQEWRGDHLITRCADVPAPCTVLHTYRHIWHRCIHTCIYVPRCRHRSLEHPLGQGLVVLHNVCCLSSPSHSVCDTPNNSWSSPWKLKDGQQIVLISDQCFCSEYTRNLLKRGGMK